ncbi:hypothetical protein IMCC3317_40370 [Kordia antarctica]|uniref:Uncharacterized protein n=2 Tax=Kordia antarctica TaxID=1218801 RepID=A0A7L4ZPH6_9FLAO|nr:hypothetical protein IMCC3317_40370 [Kordia antarctica]
MLLEIIDKLASIEQTTKSATKKTIYTLIAELEEASTINIDFFRTKQLVQIVRLYKEWIHEFDLNFKANIAIIMRPLLDSLQEDITVKSCETKLVFKNRQLSNVLIPLYVHEPFHKGMIPSQQISSLKIKFPYLFKVNTENLANLSAFELFELSQLGNHKSLGIDLSATDLNIHWQLVGLDFLKELDYPTDLQYPYVNIHKGYFSHIA